MEDIKAVVNDYGVGLHIGIATDKEALGGPLMELGGIRDRPTPSLLRISYKDELAKERQTPSSSAAAYPFEKPENALA